MMYSAGRAIRDLRTRRHISQEELSYGICSVSTLSKIETCTHNPNKKTLDALLHRLGLPSCEYNIPVTEEEFRRGGIEREISNCIVNHNFSYKTLLSEYEKISSEMTNLEKQFFLYASANFDLHNGKSKSDILSEYIKAISITIPDFCLEKPLTVKLLTNLEANLLSNIATLLYDLGKTVDSLRILSFLKIFYENTEIDFASRAIHYPVIVYNLSCCIGRDGHYEEAIEMCSNAIQMCVQAGKLDAFPMLLYNKGFCLLALGKNEEGKTGYRR